MGVARNNNFMTREDQLLVTVEAGRVVRGGSVAVRLAGWGRHRPQRWRGGCPLCYECVSDFSRRLAGFRGLQEARDDTAAALRFASVLHAVSRSCEVGELRLRRRTAALGGRWTQ